MVDDSPQELIFDLVTKAVFGRHPLGRPVLGSAEVISTVSRRSLSAFHRRRYRADNVVVATAGSVDHDRLVTLVERMRAKAGAAAAGKPSARAPFVAAPKPALVFLEKPTEQYHVCLSAPGIARSDRRRFTASVLDSVLGGSASSRLFQEIREQRGLAYAVYTFSSQYADTGQMGVYVGTREENLGECLRIVAEQVGQIVADGPRPDELDRAKENLKGRIMLSMEATSNRMSRLGKSLITDSELLDLDRILAEIEAVDAEAVARLAEVVLSTESLSVAAIGPSEERVLEAVEPVCPGLVERAAA
jgi:predicted Zn-dependent peptidase